jgi:hypothetical protein
MESERPDRQDFSRIGRDLWGSRSTSMVCRTGVPRNLMPALCWMERGGGSAFRRVTMGKQQAGAAECPPAWKAWGGHPCVGARITDGCYRTGTT